MEEEQPSTSVEPEPSILSPEKNIDQILNSIFYRNQNKNNQCLIIRDATLIPDLLYNLQDDSVPLSLRHYIVDSLYDSFKIINHNMEIFSRYTDKVNNLSLLKILIKIYLLSKPSEQTDTESFKKFLQSVLDLFKFLLSHISCSIDVYKYANDYLKNFMQLRNDNPLPQSEIESRLTKEKFENFIRIIQCLYGVGDLNIIPKNYFYFSLGGGVSIPLKIKTTKSNNPNDRGFMIIDVLMSLKLNIDASTYNLYSANSNITFLTFNFNKDSISIILGKGNLIYIKINNQEPINTGDSVNINQWFNLLVKFTKIKGVTVIKIYIKESGRKDKKPEEYETSLNYTEISSISLLKNFVGQCSSIIILENNEERRTKNLLTLLENNTFKYGFYSEEIYSLLLSIKRQYAENKQNYNQNQIQNFDMNVNITEKVSDSEIKILLETLTNVKYLYMPTRFEFNSQLNGRILLKESISHLDASIPLETNKENFNGVHIYDDHFGNINHVGGICSLLPIAELMVSTEKYSKYIDSSILNDKIFSEFLWIINTCLSGYYNNLKDSEEVQFFYLLSLFLERIPDELFTKEVMGSLKTLSTTMINNTSFNIKKQGFHSNVLLNEKIMLKFDNDKLNDLLDHIYTIFIDKSLTEVMNAPTMCSILLMFDREKYTKFCCETHKKFFPSEKDIPVLNPEMNTRLHRVKDILQLMLQKINDESVITIYEMLSKDISPCIQNAIIEVFNKFYKKCNDRNCVLFKNNNVKKFIDINCFVMANAVYDVRIQILNFTMNLLNLKIEGAKLIGEQELFLINNLLPGSFYIDLGSSEGSRRNSLSKREKVKNLNSKAIEDESEEKKINEKINVDKAEQEQVKIKDKEIVKENYEHKVEEQKQENIELEEHKEEPLQEQDEKINIEQNEESQNIFDDFVIIEKNTDIEKVIPVDESEKKNNQESLEKEDIESDKEVEKESGDKNDVENENEVQKEEIAIQEPKVELNDDIENKENAEEPEVNDNKVEPKNQEQVEEIKENEAESNGVNEDGKELNVEEGNIEPLKENVEVKGDEIKDINQDNKEPATDIEIVNNEDKVEKNQEEDIKKDNKEEIKEGEAQEIEENKDEKLNELNEQEKEKEKEKEKENKGILEEKNNDIKEIKEEVIKKENEQDKSQEKNKEEKSRKGSLNSKPIQNEKDNTKSIDSELKKSPQKNKENKNIKDNVNKNPLPQNEIPSESNNENISLINTSKSTIPKKGPTSPFKNYQNVSFLGKKYELSSIPNGKVSLSKFYDSSIYQELNYKMLNSLLEELSKTSNFSFIINSFIKLSLNSEVSYSTAFLACILYLVKKENCQKESPEDLEACRSLNKELLSNEKFFFWLIELLFQIHLFKNVPNFIPCFLMIEHHKDETFEAISKQGYEMLLYICKKQASKIDYILQWGCYYKKLFANEKKYYDLTLGFIKTILSSLYYEGFSLNKMSLKSDEDLLNTFGYYSMLYEYIIYYKKDLRHIVPSANDLEEPIKLPCYFNGKIIFDKLDDNKSVPKMGNQSLKLENKWSDYDIANSIIYTFKSLWETKIPLKKTPELATFYLEKEEKNKFKHVLHMLNFGNKTSIKYQVNQGIPLMKILFNIICLFFVESEIKDDKLKWLKYLEKYVIFLICATCNLKEPHKGDKDSVEYESIQKNTRVIIAFSISLLVDELLKRNDDLAEKIDESFKKIFHLCLVCYDFIEKKVLAAKNDAKKFINIFFKESDNYKSKAVYRFFVEGVNVGSTEGISNHNQIVYIKDLKTMVFGSNSKHTKSLMSNRFKINFYTNKYTKKKIIEELFDFRYLYNERSSNKDNMYIPIYNNIDLIINNKINYQQNLNDDFKMVLSNDYKTINNTNYEDTLIKGIKATSDSLSKKLLTNMSRDFISNQKTRAYKKVKEKLFSFNSSWSCEKLFYTNDKNLLKYKVLNHYSDDFTCLLLAPILDVMNYLPKFSAFEPEKNFFYDNDYLKDVVDLSISQGEINQSSTSINSSNINNIRMISSTDNAGSRCHILYNINKEIFKFLTISTNSRNSLSNSSNKEKLDKFKIFIKNFIQSKSNETNDKVVNCCMIKQAYHIKGLFYNYGYCIGFFAYNLDLSKDEEHFDTDRRTCLCSIFKDQVETNRYYYKIIPLNEIESVLKRRYLYRRNAIEIFTVNKKSYIFKFTDEKECDIMIKYIRNHMTNVENISIDYSGIDKKLGFANKTTILSHANCKNRFLNLNEIYKKWTNWEISNLEMLMFINIYGNRSRNDLSQYPIAPWHIVKYDVSNLNPDNIRIYRDFSIPVGMMEVFKDSIERKESFKAHYETLIEENNKDAYFFGSHYSNAMYVCHYLVRVFPYSYMKLELQGSVFDDPNRLFNSLPQSFQCAMTQKTDVRELIPEFFFMPELFYNNNKLNLGVVKDDDSRELTRVQDVKLPQWSTDAYQFIKMSRSFFEDSYVSENINNWFEIIFGLKQKYVDKNMEFFNIYIPESYEEYEKNVFNKLQKKDKYYSLKMLEFGICPNKIFKDPEKRKSYNDMCKVKNLDSVDSNVRYEMIVPSLKHEITKIKLYKNKSDIIVVGFQNEYSCKFQIIRKKEGEQKQKIVYHQEFIEDSKLKYNSKHLYLTSDKFSQPMMNCYDKGVIITKGGFYNGEIVNIQKAYEGPNKMKPNQSQIYSKSDTSLINIIAYDDNENFAFCGSTKGNVHVYKIDNYDRIKWAEYCNLYDHRLEISDIYVSNRLNIFCTCGKEGFVHVYKFPKIKMINSFKFLKDEGYVHKAIISANPLPCFAFYFKKGKRIEVFSINGHFIKKIEVEGIIMDWQIYRNYKFEESIIYLIKNSSKVNILYLPNLECRCLVNISNCENLISLQVSEDKSFAIVLGIKDCVNTLYLVKDMDSKVN